MDDAQGVREEIKRRNRAGKGVLIIIGSKEFRHGTGRSLIARTLAKAIGAKHFSTGDEFRQMARKKHMSINEYATYAEHHLEIDREFDEKTQKDVKALIDSGKNVVADSNLLAHFLKADASIVIDAPDEIRAERVYAKHRSADAKFSCPKDALEHLASRDESDRKRYEKLYGVDADKLTESYDFYVENRGELHESMDQVFKGLKEKLLHGKH